MLGASTGHRRAVVLPAAFVEELCSLLHEQRKGRHAQGLGVSA